MKRYAGFGYLSVLATVILLGCNPPADYALVGGAFVPSAHGDIRLDRIDKGENLVVITMDHLPPPEDIELGLTHYVVWFSVVGELPERQTALDYDPETRVGRASIPTSMRQFDLQITAEQSDTPAQPSDLVVASQNIREK